MDNIRNKALELGYHDARCVTAEPFALWKERVTGTIYEGMAAAHDPATMAGWPQEETTLWVAIDPVPLLRGWPEGCGEISGYYLHQHKIKARRNAWMDAIEQMGYEINRDIYFPDRAVAIRAGLGVHGLNGLLISPELGSYASITVVAVHAKPPEGARGAAYDLSPGCMMCGLCKASCPTGCITDDGVDAKNCLRAMMNQPKYMTESDCAHMGQRILGCEDCQWVCPHNAHIPHEKPSDEFIKESQLEKLLTQPTINGYVQSKYINYDHIKMQAALAAANTGRVDLLPLIEPLTQNDNEAVSKNAKWALAQLLSGGSACTK